MASSERAGQEEVSRQNTLVIDTRDILLYRGDTTLVGPLNWQVNAGGSSGLFSALMELERPHCCIWWAAISSHRKAP